MKPRIFPWNPPACGGMVRQNLELAPEGTYVYFIEIELEDGELEQFSGEAR
jgi:hypothetical protein